MIISVGPGLAEIIREKTGHNQVVVCPNGSDRSIFSPGPVAPEFATLRQGYRELAVFAGGLNQRLDYELLLSAAIAHPDIRICMFGPRNFSHVGKQELSVAKKFFDCQNVYLGPILDEIGVRNLYRTGTVGIVPYKRLEWIEQGAFPSKVFEMLSTGLPIVSTYMRSIVGVGDGIHIARNHDDFVGALAHVSRGRVSPQLAHNMQEVSDKNSLDSLFMSLRDCVIDFVRDRQPMPSDIAHAVPSLERYAAHLREVARRFRYDRRVLIAPIAIVPFATRFSGRLLRTRYRLTRYLPAGARKILRRLIFGQRIEQ